MGLFCQLDDIDIMSSIKEWAKHTDTVLSVLSRNIVERKLLKIELQDNKFDTSYIYEGEFFSKASNV